MASEVLQRISRDDVERARLVSEYKYQVDTQSKVVHAKREGRLEGRREGKREGRKEGKREGKLEGKREIARNLKAMGYPAEKIAQATGISVEQISEL